MRYGVWAPIPLMVGATRKWSFGRNGRRITAVVIHRMEGTLDGSDSYLRREFADYAPYPRLGASTHFGVGAWGWLNRSLHRYQIRQWVDTTNTAFGWAARPTDTPTVLARNTLGSDLYNPYSDLNWQVIAVEVEGFANQPWAPGLATKVKELLDVIAAAHGPLIVMAHTDCSTKLCPGMQTFVAAMPGYYGRPLSTGLPDTSQPPTIRADDVPVANFVPHNERATIRAGKPRRNGATLAAKNLGTTSRQQTFFAWGEVNGQSFGTNGDRWFFGPQKIEGYWHTVYIPRVDLIGDF